MTLGSKRCASAAAAFTIAALAAGCGASSGLSAQDHRDFVAGCSNSGQPSSGCECVYQQLTKQGVNSMAKIEDVARRAGAAATAHDLSAVPASFRNAVRACASELRGQSG